MGLFHKVEELTSFQQSPWFSNIPDNVSGLELAKLDVALKKFDFAVEKAVKIKVNVRR